jgi:hypothetical protein
LDRIPALALVFLLTPALSADRHPPVDSWRFEELHLRSGRTLHGLVEKETAGEITFAYVLHRTGEPTFVQHTTISRSEVVRIDKLDARERNVLASRLQAIERDREREKERLESLELKPAPWGKEKKQGLVYRSPYFTLFSDARPEIVRQAVLRLNQVYAAYVRFLPPRAAASRPTTFLLCASSSEYQQLLKDQGRDFVNPAFYDACNNQIVCLAEVQELGENLARLRKQNQQLTARLDEQEAEWKKQYGGKIPKELVTQLHADRNKIREANEANEKKVENARRRFFRTLYHEAFHAYLANFVYPSAEAAVPRWLNEGLAQIFETAIVEGGELRIGHVDQERLAAVHAALREEQLVPLAELLRSGSKQFLVGHASDRQLSNRYYLTCWALCYYLMFESKRLQAADLDAYIRALKQGADPVDTFVRFTGQPLAEFKKTLHEYLARLRPDGSVGKLPP